MRGVTNTLREAPNRFDSQHYNENDTPSNLFEEGIRKSQINEYSRFPKCFYPKYSRFPKCLVKTEEKYTDLTTSLRLSSVYTIYGIFPHKSIVRNEKNNKQTLKTTFKRAECVFFNHLPHV